MPGFGEDDGSEESVRDREIGKPNRNIVSSKTTTPASPLAGVPNSHNTEV